MRILRAADHRRMAWKNGGGETIEIAVFPAAAGLDDFEWRMSMARVDASGPFSVFTGVDRTLAILEGEGVVLTIGGAGAVEILPTSDPLSFAADVATEAVLVRGPIRDLNVMTRRSFGSHAVRCVRITSEADIAPEATTTILFCASGDVRFSTGQGENSLSALDAVVLGASDSTVRVVPDKTADLFVIQLFKAA